MPPSTLCYKGEHEYPSIFTKGQKMIKIKVRLLSQAAFGRCYRAEIKRPRRIDSTLLFACSAFLLLFFLGAIVYMNDQDNNISQQARAEIQRLQSWSGRLA